MHILLNITLKYALIKLIRNELQRNIKVQIKLFSLYVALTSFIKQILIYYMDVFQSVYFNWEERR